MTTAQPRILLVGDVMTDVIVRPEGPLAKGSDRRAKIRFEPGGSAANQAAWLASYGVQVDLVARVGLAEVEAETRRLARAGVTAHLLGDRELPTGRLVALIDASGERSFYTDRAANETLCPADVPDALIDDASLIHLSGYSFFAASPREAVLKVMGSAGRTPVSVDPASAEFLREVGPERFLQWTRGAAVLFPNEDEAAALTGASDPEAQCQRLAALYPLVALKLGAAGCLAAEGARRWRVEAPRVAAIDCTGAGDAFAAAFLASRLRGEAIEEALARAVAAGSAAVQQVGGRPQVHCG
jgi:sugar/nucleoside kinase (ribokinase family)